MKEKLEKYLIKIDLGISHTKKSEFDLGIKYFSEAIDIINDRYEAHLNLANLYILKGEIINAKNILLNYINNIKLDEKIVNLLGQICINYNFDSDLKKIITNIESTKKSNINFYFIFYLYAKFLEDKIEINDAIYYYEKSIKLKNNFFDSYLKILNLLESTNKLDKFKLYLYKSFKKFNTKKEINIISFYNSVYLNRVKRYQQSEAVILEHNLNLNLANNNYFYLRLLDIQYKNNEKIGNYKKAFKTVEKKNNITLNLKENKSFSSNTISNTIAKYKLFYNNKNIKDISSRLKYEKFNNLVFLVGFPRSGTTLLDTILRTHSKIKVLEEKTFLLEARHNYFRANNNKLDSLLKLTQEQKDEIALSYLKKINYNLNSNSVIIDKLPLSIIEIGFIKIIFPNSKIILALRHPCDVVISCYFNSFKINDAMVNFLDWEKTIKFYCEVFDLFEFFEKELSINFLKIKYEDVITNFKYEIANLLKYLDLDYENRLENFFITAKKRNKIFTPSYDQVINPLYSSSISRWKKYSKIKNPEPKLKKWIKKFNY